jgi:hypothetical protein
MIRTGSFTIGGLYILRDMHNEVVVSVHVRHISTLYATDSSHPIPNSQPLRMWTHILLFLLARLVWQDPRSAHSRPPSIQRQRRRPRRFQPAFTKLPRRSAGTVPSSVANHVSAPRSAPRVHLPLLPRSGEVETCSGVHPEGGSESHRECHRGG